MTPLPAELTQRIVGFLQAGHTGRIIINVHRGQIINGELCEAWRAPKADRRKGVDT